MRIKKISAALALAAATVGLSACAQDINARVTRYSAMPAPQGQTFAVVPGPGMAASGGLEFQRYAGIVSQQLAARGYSPAADARSANMVVQLGYGIDRGQVRVTSYPSPGSIGGWGPYGGPYFYPRYGYYSPFYWGWNDPFWRGGYGGRDIDSYIEYHSEIDLHIRQNGTNAPLFDGRAQARSETNRLDVVLPSLIEAIFTGFPGRNGETVKITIPTRPVRG